MKKLILTCLFLISLLLAACSNSNSDKIVIDDGQGGNVSIDEDNTLYTDKEGKVQLNLTKGADGWCEVGTTVKSGVADTVVIGIQDIEIKDFGKCTACYTKQEGNDGTGEKTIVDEWWVSENRECEKQIHSDASGNITLEKWINSEGKECARQLLDGEVTFNQCN